MKRIVITLFIGAFVFLGSCKPDETTPEKTPEENLTGDWKITENRWKNGVAQNPVTFNIHILPHATPTSTYNMYVENMGAFGGFSTKTNGLLTNSTIVMVPNQTIPNVGHILESGSISLVSSTSINLAYIIDEGGTIDSCIATGAKVQ